MDDQNQATATEATAPATKNPNALQAAMARTTVENKFAKPRMPRKFLTFTVDAGSCAPGLFDEDFDLTIGSLTSAMELEAAQAAKGQIATLAFHYARLSLVAVNGHELNVAKLENEWLWEALGTAGRQLVAGMFAEFAFPDGDAQGKARAGMRVTG